ncbi:unnamed protein product [Pedinophyceae sp. YPF-701]|nr:unnamed protein product [Pedinophyceae sp. YPF-701]
MSRGRADNRMLRALKTGGAAAALHEAKSTSTSILDKVNKLKGFVKQQKQRTETQNDKLEWVSAKQKLEEEEARAERALRTSIDTLLGHSLPGAAYADEVVAEAMRGCTEDLHSIQSGVLDAVVPLREHAVALRQIRFQYGLDDALQEARLLAEDLAFELRELDGALRDVAADVRGAHPRSGPAIPLAGDDHQDLVVLSGAREGETSLRTKAEFAIERAAALTPVPAAAVDRCRALVEDVEDVFRERVCALSVEAERLAQGRVPRRGGSHLAAASAPVSTHGRAAPRRADSERSLRDEQPPGDAARRDAMQRAMGMLADLGGSADALDDPICELEPLPEPGEAGGCDDTADAGGGSAHADGPELPALNAHGDNGEAAAAAAAGFPHLHALFLRQRPVAVSLLGPSYKTRAGGRGGFGGADRSALLLRKLEGLMPGVSRRDLVHHEDVYQMQRALETRREDLATAWARESERCLQEVEAALEGAGRDVLKQAVRAGDALRTQAIRDRLERELEALRPLREAREREAALEEERRAAAAEAERRAREERRLAEHAQQKALLAKHRTERAAAELEELERRVAEEEAEREAAAAQAVRNAERVGFRRDLSEIQRREREEAKERLEAIAAKRLERLERLRLQVAGQFVAERDFERLTQDTEASKAREEESGEGSGAGRAAVHGYTSEQIMRDPRVRAMEQMAENGLLDGRAHAYARQVVSSMAPPKPTRVDNLTSHQQAAAALPGRGP